MKNKITSPRNAFKMTQIIFVKKFSTWIQWCEWRAREREWVSESEREMGIEMCDGEERSPFFIFCCWCCWMWLMMPQRSTQHSLTFHMSMKRWEERIRQLEKFNFYFLFILKIKRFKCWNKREKSSFLQNSLHNCMQMKKEFWVSLDYHTRNNNSSTKWINQS